MSSKTRIQTYLKRNHLSELFEDMMSKLIQDLPSDPVEYLIHFLQKKLSTFEKKLEIKDKKFQTINVSSLNSSLWADSKRPKQLSSTVHVMESDGQADVNRQYAKPWLSNSKRNKNAQELLGASVVKRSQANFDKLVRNENETVENIKSISYEEDVDLRLMNTTPKIYGRPQDISADNASEMRCIEIHQSNEKQNISRKYLKPNEARKARKSKLKTMMVDVKTGINSKNPESDVDDDALELYENADDLIDEGVKNPPKTGVYTSGNIGQRKEQIELVLNMSKFFDSLGGAVSVASSNERLKSDMVDNEDFESASQVTGPRRPVWEIPESEVDSVVSQTRQLSSRRLDASMFDASSALSAKKSVKESSREPQGYTGNGKIKKSKSQVSSSSRRSLEALRNSKGNDDPSQRRGSIKNLSQSKLVKGTLERPKTAQ